MQSQGLELGHHMKTIAHEVHELETSVQQGQQTTMERLGAIYDTSSTQLASLSMSVESLEQRIKSGDFGNSFLKWYSCAATLIVLAQFGTLIRLCTKSFSPNVILNS